MFSSEITSAIFNLAPVDTTGAFALFL